jgi:hypothetical protein
MLLLLIPAVIWLELAADPLLRLWVPSVGPAAVATMRWLTMAALLDAVIYSTTNVLWGAGHTRGPVAGLTAMVAVLCATAAVTWQRVDAAGFAAIVLAAGAIGAIVLVRAFTATSELSARKWLRQLGAGYLWPCVACGAVAALLGTHVRASIWWLVASASACFAVFLAVAARDERVAKLWDALWHRRSAE